MVCGSCGTSVGVFPCDCLLFMRKTRKTNCLNEIKVAANMRFVASVFPAPLSPAPKCWILNTHSGRPDLELIGNSGKTKGCLVSFVLLS